MGFAELFEIGFFSAFIIWSNFGLTAAIYVGVGISFALQYLLLKKCRRALARYWTYALDLVAVLVCEIWWHLETGWDRLAVDIIYGLFICLLIGHLLAAIVYCIRSKRKSREGKA
jgi:hypothetical protein